MISLKRFICLVVILSALLLLLNLHMTYIQGKYSYSSLKTPSPLLYRSFEKIMTTSSLPWNNLSGYKLVSNCDNITFPYHLMAENRWQNVDTERSLYVFSAYLEGREVNVIGAAKLKGSYVCQLWYTSSNTSTVRLVNVESTTIDRFAEGHGKTYTACRITCHMTKENVTGHLLAVSISKSECGQPINLLPVVHNEHFNVTSNFTVCLTPFSNKYARAYELIEWIEFNRILGADKFIFYNLSIADNIATVIESYNTTGIIELVNWQPPMKLTKWPPDGIIEQIHYNGQLASLNDCLLRSRGRSKFIVNLDLDEYIIPRSDSTMIWNEMLKQVPQADIYVFANVFFRKEWNDSKTNFIGYDIAKKFNLVTLLRLKREEKVWEFGQRSKYMAKPEKVLTLGIHNIWSKTGEVQNVKKEVALLHHYRNWMKYDDPIKRINDEIVLDKFKDKLLNNVRQKWNSLPNVVQDIPLCDKPKDFGAC